MFLSVDEITSLQQFEEELIPVWKDLENQGSLFESFQWWKCVLRSMATEARLKILAVKDKKKLVGLAPLQETVRQHTLFPYKEISFIDNPVAPKMEFLCAAGYSDSVSRCVFEHLRNQCGFDILRLHRLFGADGTVERLQESALSYFKRVFLKDCSVVPFVTLEGTWDEFTAGKSPKFRKTKRAVANRLEKAGRVEFTCERGGEFGPELFSELTVLWNNAWKVQSGLDLLSKDRRDAFYKHLLLEGLTPGSVKVYLLRLNGKLLASEVHIEDANTAYGLRADFDETMSSLSPGQYLELRIVQHLFERRVKIYDLGPGAASYKDRWTNQSYTLKTLECSGSTLRGAMLFDIERVLKPTVKAFASKLLKYRQTRFSDLKSR